MSHFYSRFRSGFATLLCTAFIVPGIAVSFAHAASSQTVVDDLGRSIVLPHGAKRIVCLDPSNVEILYAVGAGSRIVATTPYTNYPPETSKIARIDGLNPSRELLTALRPDLIILSDQTYTAARANAKSQLYGVPVFVTNADTYVAVERDIERMGSYFGDVSRTRAVIANMDKTLADVRKRVAGRPKPTVFDIVWIKPLMTAGKDSFIGNLISLAGGIDIARDAPKYAEFPVEKLVAANPDIILTTGESLAADRESLRPLGLRALATNRLLTVTDDLTVRPGPRLALGLEQIASLLHPDAFAAKH